MEMNNTARVQLVTIVRQDGIIILENEQRLRGLLMDKCPEARREIHVVLTALREKVPHKLHELSSGIPPTSIIATQTQRLVDTTGLSVEAAQWAVETWIAALATLSKVDSRVSQGPAVAAQTKNKTGATRSTVSRQSYKPRPMEAKWVVAPRATTAFLQYIQLHPIIGQVLYNRGVRTARDAEAFLRGEDPVPVNIYRLGDMTQAVQRILYAIHQQETICVHGSSDVDGVASTALLVMALQAAGGAVEPYIPDVMDEGYGLNVDAITRIAAKAKLLVTADCGIRSLEEVVHAWRLGMDVIVTDHHTVGPQIPPALAVINPRRADSSTKSAQLAGACVAYRLAQGVLRAAAREGWLPADAVDTIEESLLDLVALGTVAEGMPLLGENRTLVCRGIESINSAPRPGLAELMRVTGLQPGTVDSTAISLHLAPRLNAAGRLHNARLAYDLLRTNDPVAAYTYAKTLEDLNRKLRALTDAAEAKVEQQLAADLAGDPPLLMAASPAFEDGVVSAVAARLVERYHRPAVVVRLKGEIAVGSAHSIPELDISRALDEAGRLLISQGGHPWAAGFTVKSANLPALRNHLSTVAGQQLGSPFKRCPALEIDAEVSLEELSLDFAEQLADLDPIGVGNPWPLLLARRCQVRSVQVLENDRGVQLDLQSGEASMVFHVPASQWHKSNNPKKGSRVDIVFQAAVTKSMGFWNLQLNVMDLRPPR